MVPLRDKTRFAREVRVRPPSPGIRRMAGKMQAVGPLAAILRINFQTNITGEKLPGTPDQHILRMDMLAPVTGVKFDGILYTVEHDGWSQIVSVDQWFVAMRELKNEFQKL